MPKKISSFC